MIHIDRSTVSVSDDLRQRSAMGTTMIVEQAQRLGPQQRLEFRNLWQQHRPLLAQLFQGKCAYCESPFLATGHGDFEQFRPKASVDEDPKHPGYYWLAYQWENHYPTCRICNVTKRNRFPIRGSRAYTPGDSLEAEAAAQARQGKPVSASHRFAAKEGAR